MWVWVCVCVVYAVAMLKNKKPHKSNLKIISHWSSTKQKLKRAKKKSWSKNIINFLYFPFDVNSKKKRRKIFKIKSSNFVWKDCRHNLLQLDSTHKQNWSTPRNGKDCIWNDLFFVCSLKDVHLFHIKRKQFTKLHATVNVVTHELHTIFNSLSFFFRRVPFSICLTY